MGVIVGNGYCRGHCTFCAIFCGSTLACLSHDGDGSGQRPCYCLRPLSSVVGKSGRLQTYIVHVQRPRNDELLSNEDVEDWHRSFLPNTTLDTGEPRLVYSYCYAMSGFAARLTVEEVKALEPMEGFLRAWPSKKVSFFTTYTPGFLGLSRWDGLWVGSNMGAGVIIGVVDTGITPSHASFMDDTSMPPPPTKWKGTCGFNNKTLCNNKLIGAFASRGTPVDSKRNGHGTHVAGIAAGNFVANASVLGLATGTASGTAPKAHLAMYKVSTTGALVASIDRAIQDGVDILSISLGNRAPSIFNDDDYAIATFAAIRKNIFVCMAAANSGPYPETIIHGAPWQMTVGASSHDRRIISTVRLGNGVELEGQSGYQPSSSNNTTASLVFPGGQGQNGTLGCKKDSFDNVDVQGKIVLCMIVVGRFRDMSINVKNAGGVGIIVLNSFVEGSTTYSDNHVIPAVHINYTDTRKVVKYFNNFSSTATATATILFNGTKFGARPSPSVPYFSSRGPFTFNGGILKPDILGPGVNILSAWPVNPGPDPNIGPSHLHFNFLSGTSMATPHLSGIVALLKSTHKNWSPAAIRSAIMTTADRFDLDGNPLLDDYEFQNVSANFFAMGSGQVNPIAANDPGLIYDITPDNYVQYLCGLGLNDTAITVITGNRVQCSNVSSILPENLNYPSVSIYLDPATNKSVTRVLTNVGNADEVYNIKVEEPKGVSVVVSPPQLKFTSVGQKKNITIQFESKGMPLTKDNKLEGQLILESPKHFVRSPISVTII
ncbi:subtilisin-like protease [Dioscorea cayenensis subsp. rotundata]|uniref:Subtilisin-like protease n=1 Tax=Dioscorea cayennensis subsp. rotundata TaxID=55577 RepID=A0AB40BWH3_DIOCR|nr:subtilisin-like protease [Dioscorea cayenensis subsp. rotundata]